MGTLYVFLSVLGYNWPIVFPTFFKSFRVKGQNFYLNEFKSEFSLITNEQFVSISNLYINVKWWKINDW